MAKEHEAAAAARQAYLAGMHFPFPANLVMAPVLGAAAFASVMAFEGGSGSCLRIRSDVSHRDSFDSRTQVEFRRN
jgi:hypothetical protein